jgi:hypothetical protein
MINADIDLSIGIYLMIIAYMVNVTNQKSKLAVKAIPFGLGFYLLMRSVKSLGWL